MAQHIQARPAMFKKSLSILDIKYMLTICSVCCPTSKLPYFLITKHVCIYIVGLLIEQLSRGTYECMVCCETIRAHHAVWNCANCHHVFHLRCIKKWARSPNAVVSGAEKDGWRCPACQNLSFKFPNQYRCFCSKDRLI